MPIPVKFVAQSAMTTNGLPLLSQQHQQHGNKRKRPIQDIGVLMNGAKRKHVNPQKSNPPTLYPSQYDHSVKAATAGQLQLQQECGQKASVVAAPMESKQNSWMQGRADLNGSKGMDHLQIEKKENCLPANGSNLGLQPNAMDNCNGSRVTDFEFDASVFQTINEKIVRRTDIASPRCSKLKKSPCRNSMGDTLFQIAKLARQKDISHKRDGANGYSCVSLVEFDHSAWQVQNGKVARSSQTREEQKIKAKRLQQSVTQVNLTKDSANICQKEKASRPLSSLLGSRRKALMLIHKEFSPRSNSARRTLSGVVKRNYVGDVNIFCKSPPKIDGCVAADIGKGNNNNRQESGDDYSQTSLTDEESEISSKYESAGVASSNSEDADSSYRGSDAEESEDGNDEGKFLKVNEAPTATKVPNNTGVPGVNVKVVPKVNVPCKSQNQAFWPTFSNHLARGMNLTNVQSPFFKGLQPRIRAQSVYEFESMGYIFYRVYLPVTSEGLLITVMEQALGLGGSFAGYRRFRDGSAAPAEQANVFWALGDEIFEVDGTNCIGMPFCDLLNLLKQYVPTKMLRLRHKLSPEMAATITKDTSVRQKNTNEFWRRFTTMAFAYRNPNASGTFGSLLLALNHSADVLFSVRQKQNNAGNAMLGTNNGNVASAASRNYSDWDRLEQMWAQGNTSFLGLLESRGIKTAEEFLRTDSTVLGKMLALHMNNMSLNEEVARDFVGAMKVHIRLHLQLGY